MKFSFRDTYTVCKKTAIEWNNEDPWRHGACVAYYAIFSIPGLITIIIWAAGFWLGEEAIRGQISNTIQGLIGSDAAQNIEAIVVSAELGNSNIWMKSLGVGTLLFGATTLFLQIQKSLNIMWGVESDSESEFLKLFIDRITSLGLILTVAFLLLITLVISAVIGVLSVWIENNFGDSFLIAVHGVNFMISLLVTSALFSAMYKILPDVEIPWRPIWVGAITTSVLFSIGKTLLGFYFGYADPASSFGAASSIILVMLWVNYTCLILFFGAKLSKIYAQYYGFVVRPSSHAKWITKH